VLVDDGIVVTLIWLGVEVNEFTASGWHADKRTIQVKIKNRFIDGFLGKRLTGCLSRGKPQSGAAVGCRRC
jgi:hypothetical protein